MKAKMFRALLPLAIVFTMVSCSSNSSDATTSDNKIVTTYNWNSYNIQDTIFCNSHRITQLQKTPPFATGCNNVHHSIRKIYGYL